MTEDLSSILEKQVFASIEKPGRYIGVEKGSIHKKWDAMIRFAIGYPDLYEVGMSNVGIQIVYHLINQYKHALCERFFSPGLDLETVLKARELPLFSLESKRPLGDFDFVGFSLQHESVYTNFLNVLALSNIPLYSKERIGSSKKYPYIFTGGPCTSNPMPLAPFVDFVIIGDGEEIIADIVRMATDYKDTPQEFLKHLATIEGIYVPSIHNKIKRRILNDIAKTPVETIIPLIDTVHYRANIEIMRGCPQWCRFCHASYTNKPVREKDASIVCAQAHVILNETGYSEIALASLSSGSYRHIAPVAKQLAHDFEKQHIKMSLPSLRVDTLDQELASLIQNNYQVGFTLAPEAGSDRLRRILRKDITHDDIMNSITYALKAKTKNIKLYFMIGLPWETQEDIEAIIDLCYDIDALLAPTHAKATVSLSTFIPKPHTPFQWCRMITLEEIEQRQQFFKEQLHLRRFSLRWHDPRMSIIEGFLTRADASVAHTIYQAWQEGSRFDAWTEHFNYNLWIQACNKIGIVLADHLSEIDIDAPLPWDHIDMGVSKEFLKKEYLEAKKIAGQ